MAGMLYSLVALGFVLIYKASGVFNFAQGAMVLFAALTMARFAEWIPHWTGITNPIAANAAAFTVAAALMFVVAWIIERLVLRHLVNQEFGTTVVLIEHDMGVVMDISDRVVVLDYGKKIGDGTPDAVRNNPEVISAYLGTSH